LGEIEKRLKAMGLALPAAHPMPNPNRTPCVLVGNILYLSGHGSARLPGPDDIVRTGKVDTEVTEQDAYRTARAVALSMMASIKHELGDLDRVKRVIRLYGMINSAPGYERQFAVMDGASDLFFELWGPRHGQHARAAVGIYELPRRSVIEIMGEFEVA
jgi:enamine deaminase RidA (YjgF/YER057c/UK114 family)